MNEPGSGRGTALPPDAALVPALPPGTDWRAWFRAVGLAVLLPALIVVRGTSPIAVLVLGAVLVLLVAGREAKVAIAVLTVALVAGVPWIVAPFVAGVAWLLVRHGATSLSATLLALRSPTRRGAAIAVLIGVAAGAVAVPVVRRQVSDQPLTFDLTTPPLWLLMLVLVGAALLNSVGEELLWRGCVHQQTRQLALPVRYAVQAISFGAAHFHGLPGGLLGCVLCAAAGVVLYAVHQRWGMTAGVLSHVVADVIIFVAVLPWILFTGWSAPA